MINIVLKRGYDGAVTQLRASVAKGGQYRYQASQFGGGIAVRARSCACRSTTSRATTSARRRRWRFLSALSAAALVLCFALGAASAFAAEPEPDPSGTQIGTGADLAGSLVQFVDDGAFDADYLWQITRRRSAAAPTKVQDC